MKSSLAYCFGVISGITTYVAVRIGRQLFCTDTTKGTAPLWAQEFIMEPQALTQFVSVELWQKKWFTEQLLGQIRVSLLEIGHRNKRGEGTWYLLWKQTENGRKQLTDHQLQLDLHFQLPPGLSSAETQQLEEKLSLYNQILEEEILVLQEQAQRLQRGGDRPHPVPSTCTIARPLEQDTCKITESMSSEAQKESYSISSSDSSSRENSLVRSSEVMTTKPQIDRIFSARTDSSRLSPSPLIHNITIPRDHGYIRDATDETGSSSLPVSCDKTPHIYVRTASRENDEHKPETRHRKQGSWGLQVDETDNTQPNGYGPEVGRNTPSPYSAITDEQPHPQPRKRG
jgi:hypothetical protein